MLVKSSFLKCLVGMGVVMLGASWLTACEDHRLTGPQPSRQGRVQKAVDSVRTALEKELGNTVPSLNLYIQTPTEEIFASSVQTGYLPIDKDARFRFASNTKTFTSTAILKMYQDGWLNYKAKISDNITGTSTPYVPNTPDWDFPYKNDITIEQLLRHGAGVFDVDNDTIRGQFNDQTYTAYTQGLDPNHQFTTEEMVRVLTRFRPSYWAPGTNFHYSNTGYSILGYIIARVYSLKTGLAETYEDYLQDSIVGPRTKVPLPIRFPVLASDQRMPVPFLGGVERLPGQAPIIFTDYNMSAQVAEGNGYSTPGALNAFMRSLMKGQNVLTTTTVKLMQSDVNPGDKNTNEYALGCFHTKNLGYGHNGERCGMLSLAMYDPDTDVSVVAYINLVDKTKGNTSFIACFKSIYSAAHAGRVALDYP